MKAARPGICLIQYPNPFLPVVPGTVPPPSFTMSQQSYVSDALSLGAVPPPSFTMFQQSYVSDALSLGAVPPP